jgi:hypothetical protein
MVLIRQPGTWLLIVVLAQQIALVAPIETRILSFGNGLENTVALPQRRHRIAAPTQTHQILTWGNRRKCSEAVANRHESAAIISMSDFGTLEKPWK